MYTESPFTHHSSCSYWPWKDLFLKRCQCMCWGTKPTSLVLQPTVQQSSKSSGYLPYSLLKENSISPTHQSLFTGLREYCCICILNVLLILWWLQRQLSKVWWICSYDVTWGSGWSGLRTTSLNMEQKNLMGCGVRKKWVYQASLALASSLLEASSSTRIRHQNL